MFSALLIFGLSAIVWSQDSTTASPDNGSGIFQVEVRTSNIGRIKYEDGEVILSQNQRKTTDIFFTPFPRIDPASTQCRENLLSDHIELTISVKLYTPELVRAVDTYLKQRFSTLCGNNGTCDISLLPMNAIRLVQKGLRTNKARQLYSINDEWHSNTLLLQSVEFIIYTANDSVCEKLRSSITEQCHLSNFEVQYSLHSEKTVERRVEITAEQVTGTSMFNQIRSQFPNSDTVALTGGDFKQLISEVTDMITMKVRVQEGFDSQLQDPISLDRLLERQLKFKQVQLETASDQLWNSLYWTRDLTRPDRLTKVINTIVRKNSSETDQFLYDSQAAKNIDKLGLTQHDIDRLAQLDKLLTANAQSSSSAAAGMGYSAGSAGINIMDKFSIGGGGSRSSQSESQQSQDTKTMTDSIHDKKTDKNHLNVSNIESNNDTQYVLSRANVEKYLSELSNHIHLEGEIIRPKPIDAHLIKLGTLRAETKLLSQTVLVRTRSNIHVLPLRCPPPEDRKVSANTTNQYRRPQVKVEQLTNRSSENTTDRQHEELHDKVQQLTATVERFTNCLSESAPSQQHKELADKVQQLSATVERFTSRLSESATSRQHKELDDKVQQLTATVERFTSRLSESATGQQHKELADKVQQLTATVERFTSRLSESATSRQHKELADKVQQLSATVVKFTSRLSESNQDHKELEKRIATLERNAAETKMKDFNSIVYLIKPGFMPPLIGKLLFDTLQQVAYQLNDTFPSSARVIRITAAIFTYNVQVNTRFSIWMWTECNNTIQDMHFKRGALFAQNTVPFDSESFDLEYCSSNPMLYVKTDTVYDKKKQVDMELFAVGYTNV